MLRLGDGGIDDHRPARPKSAFERHVAIAAEREHHAARIVHDDDRKPVFGGIELMQFHQWLVRFMRSYLKDGLPRLAVEFHGSLLGFYDARRIEPVENSDVTIKAAVGLFRRVLVAIDPERLVPAPVFLVIDPILKAPLTAQLFITNCDCRPDFTVGVDELKSRSGMWGQLEIESAVQSPHGSPALPPSFDAMLPTARSFGRWTRLLPTTRSEGITGSDRLFRFRVRKLFKSS